jgi:hypothetical protein
VFRKLLQDRISHSESVSPEYHYTGKNKLDALLAFLKRNPGNEATTIGLLRHFNITIGRKDKLDSKLTGKKWHQVLKALEEETNVEASQDPEKLYPKLFP